MSHELEIVDSIVPGLYQAVAQDINYPRQLNIAASNQCHRLTSGMHEALGNRGLQSRREFHQNDENIWHFVIAHSPIDAEPTHDDVITDLNPWQFMDNAPGHYSYLHAPRGEIMEQLQRAGAPDYFVALRGLSTIVHSHTDTRQPKLQ